MGRAAWIVVAASGLIAMRGRPARADPPPPLACHRDGEAVVVASAPVGSVTAVVAARDARSTLVVLRSVERQGRRRRVTYHAVRVGFDGALQEGVSRLAVSPARSATAIRGIATSASDAWVIVGARRSVQAVPVPREGSGPSGYAFATPRGRWRGDVQVATRDDHIALVWNGTDAARIERYVPGVPRPASSATVRLPHGTVVTAAAMTADRGVGLVVRTPGRRFVSAWISPDDRIHWTARAPAGCDVGRCPPVFLRTAPVGLLAFWSTRAAHDGLRIPGARSLDDHAAPRTRVPEFIPMARPVAVAGPGGQALVLQLGVPIVVRGLVRPAAAQWPSDSTVGRPVAGDAIAHEDGVEIFAATNVGRIVRTRLRCSSATTP